MPGVAIFLLVLTILFLPDAIALPHSAPPWRRNATALAMHGFSVATMFPLTLVVSVRPVFARLVAVPSAGLLTVVSGTKYASPYEPLVFPGLSLFSQLFRHPRIYLPFLSFTNVLVLGFSVAVFAGMMVLSMPLQDASRGLLLANATVGFPLHVWTVRTLRLIMWPDADQHQHGFYTVFVAYSLSGLRPTTVAALRIAMSHGPFSRIAEPTVWPDAIVTQNEPFSDTRQLGLVMRADPLPNFDAAYAKAAQCSQLEISTQGANTMRMESVVLLRLDLDAQGYARFYPYAYIRQPCTSLVGWFRRAGYRTLAMHPYHGGFFGQYHVLSLMYFDRFLDIRHLDKAQRAGPYVADPAVAGAIQVELEAAGGPSAFAFAMTIGNHGSSHLEHVAPGEVASYRASDGGKLRNDLTVYLRHLVNADAMVEQLTRYLAIRKRPTILCFYGDHVPAFPAVHRQTDHLPIHSDYLLWHNNAASASPDQQRCMRVHAESLGKLLIGHINASLSTSQGAGVLGTSAANTESQQQQQQPLSSWCT